MSVPAEDNGRLRDRDLQSLVNALWAAGAEAVAVDGERLAPTTTIRAAGEAILVDLRPVQSPYTLAAVGDPGTLLPRFADSEAARRYQSYTGLYGIQFTVREASDLQLRAATGPELRYAEAVAVAEPPAAAHGYCVGLHAGCRLSAAGAGRTAALRRWTVIAALALVAGVAARAAVRAGGAAVAAAVPADRGGGGAGRGVRRDPGAAGRDLRRRRCSSCRSCRTCSWRR